MIIPDYKNKKTRYLVLLINFVGAIFFFWIRKKKIDSDLIRKILIVKLDRIGDTFLATPTVEATRRQFPSAKIIFLAAPWNKEVLENNPNIDELVIFEKALNVHRAGFFSIINHLKKAKQLAKVIKEISPDIVIDLEGHPLNVLAMFKARVPIRVGFGDKVLSFLLTNKTKKDKSIHQSDIYFRIAKILGYKSERPEEKIFIGGKEKEEINKFMENNNLKNFIVIHLGAGRNYRQWPLNNFIDLANLIMKNYPELKLIIIGGNEDRKLAEQFINGIQNKDRVISVIGKLNIPETYQLLSFAKLFIGSESAPMHLAGAQNIPTIAFMSQWSGIERWKPLGEKVYVFKSKNIHKCPGIKCKLIPCPNMAAISVSEVYNFIKDKELFK